MLYSVFTKWNQALYKSRNVVPTALHSRPLSGTIPANSIGIMAETMAVGCRIRYYDDFAYFYTSDFSLTRVLFPSKPKTT